MSEYLFESLEPDSFQRFCQALLTRIRPGVQCFPIGQADGGRDAVNREGDQIEVFQVKFARTPASVQDPVKWLDSALSEEEPKLVAARARGATQYRVMTNLRGTGALDVGQIDRVQQLLSELPLPTEVWWRDDIARHLDGFPELRFSYPQLMSGTDRAFQMLVGQVAGDPGDLARALRAYVADQYLKDSVVRFRQVELQADLFDLFVDLPGDVEVPKVRTGQGAAAQLFRVARQWGEVQFRDRRDRIAGRFPQLADLLLSDFGLETLTRVIVEGAPGQGKSTIGQYLCQRLREALSAASFEGSQSARLPIRIELRDFATWLQGTNPFVAGADEVAPSQRSLESFIAYTIEMSSGGVHVSVGDFARMVAQYPTFIVLDGLDEVPDPSLRDLLLVEIDRSIKRLESNSSALNIVITTRPTAYASVEIFSNSEFTHVRLAPLDPATIRSYAEKWALARGLSNSDSRELLQTLQSKSEAPHLAELARHPMQLAILLTLIHTHGVALPDKRTALYDEYMNVFFNREAEKSAIVRNERDLIIDVHRYLGWELQCRVESGSPSGRVTQSELLEMLGSYLQSEGHREKSVDDLFAGVTERVVALVQRVEGFFEFEVQPIREYYAAKHLYETAPYSPPGQERRGTKPDIALALARSPYWYNVLRFFAGCFSKGELASLSAVLEEIEADEEALGRLRALIVTYGLIGDWVFNQVPQIQGALVRKLCEPPNLAILASRQAAHLYSDSFGSLPADAADEAADIVLDELESRLDSEWAFPLGSIAREFASRQVIQEHWERRFLRDESLGLAREVASALMITDSLGFDTIDRIWLEDSRGNREWIRPPEEWAVSSPARWDRWRQLLADDEQHFGWVETEPPTCPGLIAATMASHLYVGLVSDTDYFASQRPISTEHVCPDAADPEVLVTAHRFVDRVLPLLRSGRETWRRSLDVWTACVNELEGFFGECRNVEGISALGSLIAAGRSTKDEWSDWRDVSVSQVLRFRYARLRHGDSDYWTDLITSSLEERDPIPLALFLACASEKSLRRMASVIGPMIASMPSHELHELERWTWNMQVFSKEVGTPSLRLPNELIADLGPRAFYCMRVRLTRESYHYGVQQLLSLDESGVDDPGVLRAIALYVVIEGDMTPEDWRKYVAISARLREFNEPTVFARASLDRGMPQSVAAIVLGSPLEHGSGPTRAAVHSLERAAPTDGQKLRVRSVAEKENWAAMSRSV